MNGRLALILCGLAGVAHAKSAVVTNLNDTGLGSLRQALAPQGTEDITVTFQAGLSGTLVLKSPLVLAAATPTVTITGPGAKALAIDGSLIVQAPASGNYGNLLDASAAGTALKLTDVTLQNATASRGGCLHTARATELARVHLKGCKATNAAFPGGGVRATGPSLTVSDSTLSANTSAWNGGAIEAVGNVQLTNVTLYGNVADAAGGGLALGPGSTATLAAVTVTANYAKGHGGGLRIDGAAASVSLRDVIVAGNSSAGSEPDVWSGLMTTAAGTSLFGSVVGFEPYVDLGGNVVVADAALGTLTDNGGPTPTCLPTICSPARDGGAVNGGLASDQRGTARPIGGRCDIGAVEAPAPGPNQTPGVELQGAVTPSGTEDTYVPVPGLVLTDPDACQGALTVTLASSRLSLTVPAAGLPSIAGNGTTALTFSGSLAAVNAALAQLVVRGDKDVFGETPFAVTVDDQGNTGTGGGKQALGTFLVALSAVNDPPSFVKGPNVTVSQSSGPKTVVGWATGASKGPTNLTAYTSEETQALTYVVVGNTNPALFATAPAVSSTGTLTFSPAPGVTGSADVTLRLKDDGGTANGGSDTSSSQTFTVSVVKVNQAPSFVPGTDVTANEDAGVIAVPWATGVSAGPNELGQGLGFVVIGDTNPALFDEPPAILPDGTLTFRAAPDAFGLATITVVLKDDGGVANGGADTSAPASFFVLVRPVNDAPAVTAGKDAVVAEDAGAVILEAWLGAVSAGPSNELGQSVVFETVSVTPADLFAKAPVLSPSGSLSFTPTANASGQATVVVRARDNGGTEFGGVDVSADVAFTVTITAVNDAPAMTGALTLTTPEDTAGTVPLTATDLDGPALTFALVAPPKHGLALIEPATGLLTYTPSLNYAGPDTLEVRVSDGFADSLPVTVNVTVTPVNDAPVLGDQTVSGVEDAAIEVTLSVADPDGPTATVTVTKPPAHGTLQVDSKDPTHLVYVPDPNYVGPDSFEVAVSDGLASDAATVTVEVTESTADDDDGDGVDDTIDNCPKVANTDQKDLDQDGLGDVCDSDDDGDGIADGQDNCATVKNTAQPDQDGDGQGDPCDGDLDGDGAPNEDDNCPYAANANQADGDQDGQGDACDPVVDPDGDGVTHGDNCPGLPNANQKDLDQDGIGDVCDPDLDGDGVPEQGDAACVPGPKSLVCPDNCPELANPTQSDADDDGLGDACDPQNDTPGADHDGDGVPDGKDNCPTLWNADQTDADKDGIGDLCEPDGDRDGDGVINAKDNCPDVKNTDQSDHDRDGIGDVCDLPWRAPFGDFAGGGLSSCQAAPKAALPVGMWLVSLLVLFGIAVVRKKRG